MPSTYLVFGATGGTGKHFVTQALKSGHYVRALVRSSSKLEGLIGSARTSTNLRIVEGSIGDVKPKDMDGLVRGSDYVVCMLGEKEVQKTRKICAEFVTDRLVPSMRRCDFRGRFLYQAGGLTCPPGESLSWMLWTIRNTVARSFIGQHEDNEAVMEFLHKECGDMEWIVHLAGISGDGETKGRLKRNKEKFSIGNHRDCADFSLRVIEDDEAVRGWWFSRYA
ncbi:hypothetical protein AC579_5337 [Pseudocercospora musae]|uniref:NAD(P)-binding domain-containing protein n=1 Tax=Pseudocercospora musae TaxID=113226 RepID=A0A139IT61_9PEZI|nr:hypothetical protein AC579_5337 [Pseudocercospora musae]